MSCIPPLFFFFFLPHHACGILVPPPGMEPTPPALEARRLNHWTAREVPVLYHLEPALFIFTILELFIHYGKPTMLITGT